MRSIPKVLVIKNYGLLHRPLNYRSDTKGMYARISRTKEISVSDRTFPLTFFKLKILLGNIWL